MKTENRFSVMEVENAKGPGVSSWIVFDASEGICVQESSTREDAQKFADAQNAKEFLRTAPIVSIEKLSDYLKRTAGEDHRKRSSN
jgi:hypothetical protein